LPVDVVVTLKVNEPLVCAFNVMLAIKIVINK
jgi:hypothetical protein